MPGSITFFLLLGALITHNVTLAESECCTQLWLLEATCNDTSTMLTQIHEFKSFLTQLTFSRGKGPYSLAHERVNRATQIQAAKTYTTEFSNKNAHCAALEENAYSQVFVPLGWCKAQACKD